MKTTSYTPSHIRRQQRALHDLEIENANLRNRLAAAIRALEQADATIRRAAEFEAYLSESAKEITKRAALVTGQHYAKRPWVVVLAAERQAVGQEKGRATVYVADRDYARKNGGA